MRIAVAQTPGTRLEQWPETLTLIENLIGRAADLRADLVVLPECVWPAYCLGSRQAWFDARQTGLPHSDHFVERLTQLARAKRIAVCAGYVEQTGERLANAACLIDAAGNLAGMYRKCFLWDFDHDCFEPGQEIRPVDTALGPVGLMICADARLPEIPATLAARGARLILHPTAWVNIAGPQRLSNPQPEFLIPARAREFGVPIASASKWGVEGETTFVGLSLICDAEGNVLAQCGTRETTVVAADVEPVSPRRPQLTDSERAALLSPHAPVRPRADVGPVIVLPLPPGVAGDWSPQRPPQADVDRSAVLAVSYGGEQQTGAPAVRFPEQGCAVLSGSVADPFEIGGVRIAATNADEASRFAAIRRLALQGVHLVVVFGISVPDNPLRARACENRVYLLGVGPDGWCVIDPGVQASDAVPWPSAGSSASPITLSVALSADKCFAPKTDLLANRRPSQYAL